MKYRHLRHIIAGVIAWALFGYYWSLVAQRRITDNTVQALVILSICVAAIWLLTSLWVQHNRRRFANREDRRQRRSAPDQLPEVDAIGQRVEVAGSGEPLSVASWVVIDVDAESGIKTFRTRLVPDEGGPS
jgi:hypothetical protein